MRFPQIQIRTTDAKLDLNIAKPQQNIKQPKATQHIEQPAAILEIHTTRGVLKIDSSQARRDIGMIGPLEATKNAAAEGKQAAFKGTARRASEGRQMMMSAGKGQGRATIQNIAKQNHGPHRTPFNIKFVPSIGSVKIDYTPGTTDVNIQRRAPIIDAKVNKPIHEYTPGKVTGTMVQRPNVDIDVII
ncbi:MULTISPECIES: DUF6470 family protein [Lysinibacillus]|uniref:DUF6470 family protein n=1 Tax=Lysinibacillus TaxID=400634 RepID=UPI0008251F4D|nr:MULTISPECIES: DUF6470 family protein [Lysinibacillus]MEC1305758.1 DUF6470 family protein [Lysinibacillus capsici]OCX65259.1 hypothetical protein BFM98_06605 [Lysinibacillus sp. AR18-8]